MLLPNSDHNPYDKYSSILQSQIINYQKITRFETSRLLIEIIRRIFVLLFFVILVERTIRLKFLEASPVYLAVRPLLGLSRSKQRKVRHF